MQTDVVVIGGGPAGSATTYTLARAGARVAILERTGFGGRRVGELAAPGIAGSLQSMGLWQTFVAAGHQPVARLISSWSGREPSVTDFFMNPLGTAWMADRPRLDALLFEAAAGAGASAFRDSVARRCVRDGDRWVVEAWRHGRPLTFEARYVVDATGRARGVRPGRRTAADRLVACCCYIDPPRADSSADSPLVEAAEDGWWFSAVLPNGTLVVAYFTDADLLPSRSSLLLDDFWRRLARAPMTRAQLPHTPRRYSLHRYSADTQWRPACEPHRLAVGDALMSLDPLCGQGIVAALESGRSAAHAIVRDDSGDDGAVTEWQRVQRQRYEQYLVDRVVQYRAERRWPRSAFWRRRVGAAA